MQNSTQRREPNGRFTPADLRRFADRTYLRTVCARCQSIYFDPLPLQPQPLEQDRLCPWCRGECSASAMDWQTDRIETEGW
jgi:hypothetical protein